MQLLASFPPWSEVLKYSTIGILIAVAILSTGVGLVIFARRQESAKRRNASFCGAVFIVIGVIQLATVIAEFYPIVEFKSFISSNDIVAFEIRSFPHEESEPVGPAIRFTDKGAIGEALDLLSSSGSRWRNHESFESGYSIRLIAKSPLASDDMRILVFKSSQQIGNDFSGRGAVIPAIGTGLGGGRRLGECSCPAFEKWIQKYIDPVMAAEASYRELLLAMQEGDEDAARRLTTELGFTSLLRSYDPSSDVAEADVGQVLKDRGQSWSAQQVRWDWALWKGDEPIALAAHGKPAPLWGRGLRFRQADGAWKLDEVVLGKYRQTGVIRRQQLSGNRSTA